MFIGYTIYVGFSVTSANRTKDMRTASICISSGVIFLAFIEWLGSGFALKVIVHKLGYIVFLVLLILSTIFHDEDSP